MQPQLQRLKIKPIIFDDNYLSIKHTTCGQSCAQGFQQLRKVTIKWFFVAALDENFISVPKHQCAKTIPLRLENPIAFYGEFVHTFCEDRQDRRVYWKVHTP